MANFDEIHNFIIAVNPVAVCISETHLTQTIYDSEVEIDGYNLIRSDSNSRHTGGVLIYVRSDVTIVSVCKKSLEKNYWFLFVKVRLEQKIFYNLRFVSLSK